MKCAEQYIGHTSPLPLKKLNYKPTNTILWICTLISSTAHGARKSTLRTSFVKTSRRMRATLRSSLAQQNALSASGTSASKLLKKNAITMACALSTQTRFLPSHHTNLATSTRRTNSSWVCRPTNSSSVPSSLSAASRWLKRPAHKMARKLIQE